jgi:Ni/Fe-hydrogenase subunit HybB-like protein
MSAPANSLKRPLLSVGNVVTAGIFLLGFWLTYLRFTGGLGAVTNLDQNNPWGFWIGLDLLCGVALAAGGYTTAAAVEIFGMKKYHAALRPAILTGFLGYSMVVLALVYDVGRPWRLPYPFFVSQGVVLDYPLSRVFANRAGMAR